MFKCLECGKKIKTAAAMQRALSNGCPRCKGFDIDLDINAPLPPAVKTVGGVDYNDPPLRRRLLAKD
jgi:hypothetical protein